MPPPTRLLCRGAAIALATLLVAACGATASPSPSAAGTTATATAAPTPTATPEPTPTATPEPTQTPDPTPSVEPSGSEAAVDPTADLEIAAPYELEPLDEASAAAFEAGITQGLGAMGEVIDFGAMTVTRDGEQVAILLAMAFPDFPGSQDPSFFQSVMGGVAGSSGGQVETTTIGGKTIGLIEGPSASFAGYQQDSTVIFAIGPSIDESTEVVTALIEANP
jgi:hypothetical protein